MNKNNSVAMILASNDYSKEEKEIIKELHNSVIEWETASNLFNNVSDANLIDSSLHMEDEAKCRYSYFLSEAKRLGIKVDRRYIIEELNYSRW